MTGPIVSALGQQQLQADRGEHGGLRRPEGLRRPRWGIRAGGLG